MLTFNMVGDQALIAKLNAYSGRAREELKHSVTKLALLLEQKVKYKLSGSVLNVRTGALRASIFHEITETKTGVFGKVGSSGDVKYAGIHEFGGRTAAHLILPVKANVLHFFVGGKEVFARRVNHPGSQMPERSFLRSSLSDMKEQIVREMQDAVRRGMT